MGLHEFWIWSGFGDLGLRGTKIIWILLVYFICEVKTWISWSIFTIFGMPMAALKQEIISWLELVNFRVLEIGYYQMRLKSWDWIFMFFPKLALLTIHLVLVAVTDFWATIDLPFWSPGFRVSETNQFLSKFNHQSFKYQA